MAPQKLQRTPTINVSIDGLHRTLPEGGCVRAHIRKNIILNTSGITRISNTYGLPGRNIHVSLW